MRLNSFHQRARLSAASAIDQLRNILAKSAAGSVTQQLDLSELEDRILLSASPVAVMVESAPAAESVNIASPLAEESPSLFAPPQTAIGESPDSTSVDSLDQAGQTSGDIVSQPTSLAELDEIAGSILSESTAVQTATEVIFIDEAAEDFEQLIADLESQRDAGRAIDFFVLDSQQDGIDQIAETLARYSDLDAVHIVSHGTSGAVKLGATWLRIGSLDAYAGTIAGWGSAISTDGDILIYGCDLASNSRGELLVDSISALTGADVAASTDDTGSALLGGDWDLEYQTGVVESSAAFSEETQQDWVGLLAVITVDTFNDLNDGGDTSSVLNLITTPGTDGISLREAIIATNADSAQADDIFFFSAGTYTLSLEGSLEELAATGDLDITDDLTIHGLGAASTIIDASGMTVDKDRVFDLFSGATVTISDVTIMNGGVTGAGVAGGAITVQAGATLTLSNSIVENNISNNGGAISNDGVLTVTDTIFRNNTATNGGAINNGGSLTLTDVEFDGNTASNQGGGINTGAGATLNNVTFTGNSASTGGALRAFGAGTVSLTNVTMSGNSATNGGGIHTNKLIDATNITLVNTVSGGGILLSGGGGNVNLLNSILANNTGGNTNSAVTSLGYNIEDGGTAFAAMTGDQQNVAGLISQLGPLQNNGGFTKTHALLVGSQAIDPAGLTGAPATDQRGFTRDATPDIGAFEFVSPFTATSEFLVNTTVGDVQQTNAEDRGSQQAVSLAADGSYVVAWSSVNQDGSGWGVYARRLNSAGAALTGEVQVAQTTADNQQWARVASDDAGNFVVTWTSTNQDGTPQSVYARRFAADGTALTSEFRVHTTASGSQVDSAIAMDAVGNFVIAWEGNGPGDTTGVFARRFDSTGTPIDVTEFAVNTDTTGTQSNAAVAMNLAGEFVVIWDDANGVHGRHFDNAGTPQGPQFNIDSGNSAGDGAIAMDNAGGFVVVWRETTLDIGIHARRFDSLDTPLGISTIVNTTTFGDQTNPSITMDDAGDYIIVWEGVGTGDSDGVFARKYDSSGTALTGEFRVNDTTTNTQSQTSVAMLDVDNFVVVWSGEGAGDVDGVFARQFHHVPPVLDLDANNSSGSTGADFSANFTDGGGAVAIVDSDATLTDGNDTDLQSLTVTITDRQDGSNELLSANTAGTSIVASFNSFFGVLTLSGMDTVEHYEQVLRTVTYDNGINPATGPSRTITFVANDGVTNSNLGTTSLSINATPNQSPTADAGGPYVINEGGVLNLDGSASSDPDTDPLTFAWDLDNDGNFGEAGEPVTETPTVTWATLQSFGIDDDSGGPYTISLRVADGKGGFDTATTMLTVNNVAPTLSTTGTGAATAGSSYTLNLAASDPGADTISSWTINWGDGTIETIAGNPSTANHTYTATGFTFNILASATDEDGTYLQNELLVASSKNDRVLRYGSDAGFLQAFATSDGSEYPVDTIIGPDGNLYLSGWNSNDVLRYNATTGVFIDAFVSAGSGGLTSAAGLGFGPDGDLYVASRLTSEVLRFDGSTGAFIDAFVTAGSGGLDEAEGLTFGPNGDLYVSDYVNNAVYKYDGNTGVFDSVFVTSGSGGLDKAEDLVFGPDGNLYVADDNGSSVLRYNGTTGAFIDDFIPSGSNGLTFATGVDFGPDGNLYIGSWGTDNVLRFDGTTGAFIDEYISAGSGGLDEPGYFTFIPEHQVTVSAPPNNAPTADAGGPYAINEGDSVNLIGSASSDPDLDTLTYAWDLDNDGNFGEVGEPTTETPTVSWTTLVSLGIDDDPGSPFTIGLQVDDGNGGVDTTTTTLTVSNVNPTGNADGGAGFTTNEDTAFTTGSVLTNDTDPNLLDVLSVASLDVIGTTGLVVNNADGTFSYDPNGQFESLASGQQTTDTFSYAVSDDDGGSSSATVTITIDGANDAPTDISLDSLTVSESVAGAVVGNLSTTDIDTGDTHTYVVDDTRFEVVGGQLKLKAAAILDFETEMAVNVTITSTDALGLPVNEAFVLTVTDVNDIAPVIDPAQSFNIAEDIANLAVVGVVTATDDDTTGEPRQNWMIIGGDPAGVFAINGATGQITIADNTTLDFDTAPTSYALSVTTSDGTNTSAAETVTINLTDVNDIAPVIDPAQSFNIAENIANLAVIGTVTASDADTTGEPRQNWMIIGGDPAEAFAINGATGQITIADNSTLDFDFAPTSYVLTLTTSDGTNTSAAETVTINLTDVNDEVPVVPSGQSFNLAENVANTTVVGTVIATDADTGDALNWSITGGNPGGTFAVNSATGQITVASNLNLDFETTPTFNVTLRVEDAVGAFDTAIVTVSLLNQNEAPTADDAVFAVGEDAALGLSIGVVAASDPDAGDTRSWSILSGNTNGAFSLNSLTGELTVASPSTLDFETTPTYTLNVQAQDVGGLTDSATVVVNVSNVDEAPTTTGLADVFVNEDSADVVIDLKTAFSDVETPSAALSYSIVGNSNPTLFSGTPIVGGNLTLKFAADANGNAFVTVRATDPQGLFVTTAFNVVVTPVADAPTSTADSYVVVGDQLTVPPAGGVLANDSDPDGDAISALLVSGPANGSLVLLSNGGFTYTPNDDFRGIDTFVYEPFDGAATGPQRTVVLNVTRAIAPPPPTDSGSSDSGESDDAASAAESDGSESAEATIDAPPSAVDGSVQSSVVVESADGATSQASESADDDANEELDGPYTASESGEDFLSGPAQRLELRDAASVIVKTLNDVNSDGDSTDSDNRFRDSLRFDGEDLSYLVSTEFIQELEQVEDEFEFHGAVPEWATGTAVATTASISVGYIMWMLRGGYVLASVLSTMPVWQNIDPLPVLAALDAADDEDDDSLETMIDRASDEADDSEGLSSDEAASDAERKDQIV